MALVIGAEHPCVSFDLTIDLEADESDDKSCTAPNYKCNTYPHWQIRFCQIFRKERLLVEDQWAAHLLIDEAIEPRRVWGGGVSSLNKYGRGRWGFPEV